MGKTKRDEDSTGKPANIVSWKPGGNEMGVADWELVSGVLCQCSSRCVYISSCVLLC